MTKSEYDTLWRQIRKASAATMFNMERKTRFSYYEENAMFYGLKFFESFYRNNCTGYALSVEEYELYIRTAEDFIRDVYISNNNVWLAVDKARTIRISQYYMWVRMHNNLRRKQRAGEVLSNEEMRVLRWNQKY